MKRLLIGISVLANLLTIAGLVALYFMTDGFAFIEKRQARLRSFYEVFPVEEGDVVFLGDSITQGAFWGEMFPGASVKNRGIGGDTSQGVLDRLHTITAGRPAQIFLKIGTNDITALVPKEDIAANVGTIIDQIHRESAGTEVYVQSVLPRDPLLTGSVVELNALLEPVVRGHGATWVDVFPVFLDAETGAIRRDYANDQLHLMGPGYVAWRDALRPWVRGAGGRVRVPDLRDPGR